MQSRLQGMLGLWRNLISCLFQLFSTSVPWWKPLPVDQEIRLDRTSFDVDIPKPEAPTRLNDLPTELVFLIFSFTMPPSTASSSFLGLREGPWVLSAVCSSWRSFVLSQPCFWNSISLDFADDDPESPSFSEMEPKLKLLLARSVQAPLSITFRACFCTDRERRALDLLALHCERWGSLNFTGPPTLCSRLDVVRGNLPLLRALDIRVHQDHIDKKSHCYDMFDACPSLRSVSVNAGRCGGDRPLIAGLPFAQLRRYCSSNPWEAHAHALRSAPSLVECVLHLSGPSAPSGPPITLPHLLRLSISKTHVLDFLETPALEELYCCEQSSHLDAFLARTPTLQKLFVAVAPSTPDIAPLLRVAKRTTNLCLYLPTNLASDLFSLLAPPPRRDGHALTPSHIPPIPALRALSLCLVPIAGKPLDQGQLMQAVEALARDGALRSLKLSGTNLTPSPGTLARMERLRASGVDIVIFPATEALYPDMIPEDFRMYNDRPYRLHESLSKAP
ncbi:hypothetical protein C8R47DRAFT_674559 [Mycena vitilis]|nr:hypothetical protein C8R47DRAFT_674559 [Mycena vitilis]